MGVYIVICQVGGAYPYLVGPYDLVLVRFVMASSLLLLAFCRIVMGDKGYLVKILVYMLFVTGVAESGQELYRCTSFAGYERKSRTA